MLPEIGPVFQIPEQYFRTGMAVACCLMMIKPDSVVITQDIQSVAYAGKQFSTHLHGTEIANIWLPFDIIIPQTFLQHTEIKYGIVRNQQTA